MKDLFTVAKFTVKDMVKRKSFIISNLIILLIIVLAFNIPNILNAIRGEDAGTSKTKILIIDENNIFEGTLEQINNMELDYDAIITNDSVKFEDIKQKIENEEIEEKENLRFILFTQIFLFNSNV